MEDFAYPYTKQVLAQFLLKKDNLTYFVAIIGSASSKGKRLLLYITMPSE